MSEDARYRIKVWLETYVNDVNLTKDDDSTYIEWIVAFGYPDYSLIHVFKEKCIDLIFSISDPDTEPLRDADQIIRNYREHVPITIWCIDKTGITGTKLRWKAERELRRIAETHPEGSQRNLMRMRDNDKRLGSTILYSRELILDYVRAAA